MRKLFYIFLFFNFSTAFVFSQSPEKRAIASFKKYYADFKKAYPADNNKDSLKDFSDVWEHKSIPEELKTMMEYDSKFYISYLYQLKYSRDTLTKISSLDFSPAVKETYSKFRKSVLDGQKKGEFDKVKDKEYSQKLKTLVDQIKPPLIGYYQTATLVSRSPDKKVSENKIIITYSLDFDVIEFAAIEK